MYSPLDALKLVRRNQPEGLRPGADRTSIVAGTLLGLDIANRLAQVSIAGSEGVWVPAAAAIYPPSARVLLSRSPLDGGRLSQCLGPVESAEPIVMGKVVAINTSAGTLTVDALGGQYKLPYNAGTYTIGAPVYVRRDPAQFGVPVHVDGLQGNYVAPDPGTPGEGAPNTPKLISRQAVLQPQASASWRGGSWNRWSNWNVDRFGGPSTLWQGDAYGSGPMTGWAGYGNQVADLRAQEITGMWANVVRADTSDSGGRIAVLQGSPDGSRPNGAPGGSGDTASSGSLTPGRGESVALPSSTFNTWRTGGFKGIRLTGGQYAGFYGTSRADGMTLTVNYRVLE